MKCLRCGAEQPEDARFCNKCGGKMGLVCPQCGSTSPFDSNFCNSCGYDLCIPKETKSLDFDRPRSYTPKHLAEKILTARNSIEGERKTVTVMFADAANSTAMFEKLDPEAVHDIMDGCFRLLMDAIHRYEGTISQFLGDGVMALFGAPIAHEDHAQRACYSALAIQNAMGPYGGSLKSRYGIDFKMRIGLNTGPVVVGGVGDDLRMDYTAKGDTVNLAARMESSATPGTVLVSEHGYRQVRDFFEFEPIGKIRVKGKGEPVEAYRLVKPTEVRTRIAASAARGLTRFVGRTREIETLKEAFDRARSGEGQVVGIVGEAGVGKSRLLLEFRASLPSDEYVYFEGRCLRYGGSMPYLPVLDILRFFAGVTEGEEESVVKQKLKERILGLHDGLGHIIQPFQELLSVKVDDEAYAKLDPKQKREKTFEALRDLFIRSSQDRPLALAIEDLHWIDRTTEEFLAYMIGWLPRTRILLLLLYRPEYTHQWGSKSYYSRVPVGELSTGKSAELVGAILGGGDAVPELRELIFSRTAGNPFFMEELTRALLENGSIQKKGENFILARDVSGMQVPDTVQGIIAARLDHLEESLKRIVQVAAVIGREFAFRILETISDIKEDLKSGLVNLQGLEFIYEKGLFPELEFIFKHALTQEVAYNSLLLQRRKEIHGRIGKAIEELYPHRLEEFYEMLAYHWARGENFKKAVQYLTLSADKATRNNSLWEAYGFYKEALATLRHLPESEERRKEQLDVLTMAATTLYLLGFPEGSLDMLREGEALARQCRDSRRLGFLYGRLSLYFTVKGNSLLAVQYSEDALEEGRRNGDIDLIVPLAQGITGSYLASAQFHKLGTTARSVLDLLEQEERESDFFGLAENPYTCISGLCGLCLGWQGNFPDGELFLEKGLRNASRIGDPRTLGIVEFLYGNFCGAKGDWRAAAEHLQKGITYNERMNFLTYLAWSWSYLGISYVHLGDLQKGISYLEKGLRIQRDAGIQLYLGWQYMHLGDVYLQADDVGRARGLVEEGLRLCQQNREIYWEALAWIFLGRILGRADTQQIHKAEECVLRGMKIADELKAKPFYAKGHLFVGEIYTNGGQRENAVENLQKAETMFREMGMDYWLEKARNSLAKL